MTAIPTITTERVDDVPLLLAQMRQMDLPHLIDSYFAAHGNWQGLDPGWVTTIWLAHVLSQADHRLSYVQPWAAQCLHTLHQASGQPVRALDFTDDRLARLLELFSADAPWGQFEAALTRRLLSVYDLAAERVRLDSTTASGYWGVDEEGLFQFGHSSDKRPDLPQLKVMLATLDPLPLPIVTHVLPGQAADDPLYIPAIREVRRSLGRGGLLYVGDCKMAALATRAELVAGRDFYLLPLPEQQLPADWQSHYLADVDAGTQALTPIRRQRRDGEWVDIAVGYERTVPMQACYDAQDLQWTERHLVVRSLQAAQRGEQGLRQRLAAAQQQVLALAERGRGKKRPADRAALEQAITAIIARQRVAGLLAVQVADRTQQRPVRGYQGGPPRVAQQWDFSLTVTVDAAALDQTLARLGWRVYATNGPVAELALAEAVLCYRDEYRIEQSFRRLKGAPLSVSPFYLQRDDHAKGLVRLLSLGLRVLALLEFAVRRRLAAEGAALGGLYAGQPQATTARPTTERLLASFRGLTLTIGHQAGAVWHHLTPLSALQQRILELVGFPPDIYAKVAAVSREPP